MRLSKVTLVIILISFLLMAAMTAWGGRVVAHVNSIDEQQRVTIDQQNSYIQKQQEKLSAALHQLSEYRDFVNNLKAVH